MAIHTGEHADGFRDPAENLSFVSMDGRAQLADAQKTQMQTFLRQFPSLYLIFVGLSLIILTKVS